MPEPDQLLDQIGDQNARALRYSRRRFLATWLALALLAILTCVAILLGLRSTDTNLDQTDEIARLAQADADSAQESSDDVVAYLRGETGIPGVPGADGQDGTPGQPGTGEAGAQGEAGRPGSTGEPGSAGAQGSVGLTGTQGPPGAIGSQGAPGPQGEPGEPGATGERGSDGASGESGPKGEPGASGSMGPQGPVGPAGPTGPAALPTTALAASVSDPTDDKVVTATCTDGKRVTGGGYALVPNDPGIIVTASAPAGVSGWSVTATELSLPVSTAWQLLVFAVCA